MRIEIFEHANALLIKGARGELSLPVLDAALRDLLMILEAETAGASIKEICFRHGYRSAASYYRKRRLLLQDGLSGLLFHKRGPKHRTRLTDGVIRAIVSRRFLDPSANSLQIAADLSRRGHAVSARSVERVLQEYGISRSRRSRHGGERV